MSSAKMVAILSGGGWVGGGGGFGGGGVGWGVGVWGCGGVGCGGSPRLAWSGVAKGDCQIKIIEILKVDPDRGLQSTLIGRHR